MKFHKHSELEGLHAFLGASKSSWLRYDDDKLITTYRNHIAAQRGTELHELAAQHIKLKIKMPRSKKTLNEYINDAIGYRMEPEVLLYYSPFCFGTADAIKFENNFLRIHDLKTGVTKVHMDQLRIYAALFCLEYNIRPGDIRMELRIYQNDEVIVDEPTAEDIAPIMDKIKTFDKLLKKYIEEED